MNEEKENLKYKKYIRNSIKKGGNFCPFRKEKQMDYLFKMIQPDFEVKNQKILEAGSGYGRLIHFLNQFDPCQNYVGIDYVRELIMEGRRRYKSYPNICFIEGNLLKLSNDHDKAYDIAISYKTLSWLPYYETMLKGMIKATKKKIYITSLFHDDDIDYITKVYSGASEENGCFSYLNTYSFPKFKKFCKKMGVKSVTSENMKIDIDLEKNKDINYPHTFTTITKNGERLEITGNVILNWKIICLTL